MARLTEKQFWNLANEFHAYVKGEELVGHTINTVVLKRRYWPGFCKIYGRRVPWLPCFAETIYALRLFDLVEIVSKGRASDVIVKEMVSESVETELLKEFRAKKEMKSKGWMKRKSARNVVHHGVHSGKSFGALGAVLLLYKPAFADDGKGRDEFVKLIRNVPFVSKKDSTMCFKIKNTSNSGLVVKKCEVDKPKFALSGSVISAEEKTLIPGEEASLKIRSLHNWRHVGICTCELQLEIEGGGSDEKDIARAVYVVRFQKKGGIVTKHAPKRPYHKAKLAQKIWCGAVISGKRPPPLRADRLEREVALEEYKIPSNVRKAVRAGTFLSDNLEKALQELLKADLTFENYSSKFDLLLYLKEIQMSHDIFRYNMYGVKMTQGKQGNMMYLKVPGLAKKRPSVFPGDCVHVTIEGGAEQPLSQKQYKCYVYAVEPGCIGVKFSDDLLSQVTAQTRYNVRFTFSRYLMKLLHRAVNMEHPEILLFPRRCKTLRSEIKITGADLSNPKIADNKEQLQAVNNIVRGKESSVPYIIFGPPGTGKTVTMIEAIYQVIKNEEDSHILVYAHSNNACDHLTKLLLKHVEIGIVFRMHAASRNWADISDDVRLVSNYANGNFYFPPKEDLARYRIIICTLFTAGRLANAKFSDDHFTHVFIDEAGQATEPECMVGLGGILSKDGQVVLAGEPLKPIVRSPIAKEYGLGVSYLQRLMDTNPLYQKNPGSLGYDPQYITELSKNYRSQEANDQSLDQSQVFDFHPREGHCPKPVVIN